VPYERREGFDAAIAEIARDHELFHLSYEGDSDKLGFALELRHRDRTARVLAIGDGHAEWLSAPAGGSDDGEGRPDGLSALQ
jgi:hypothetical protein